jgi:hypothetical protein
LGHEEQHAEGYLTDKAAQQGVNGDEELGSTPPATLPARVLRD